MGQVSAKEFFKVGYGKVSISESDRVACEAEVGWGGPEYLQTEMQDMIQNLLSKKDM